MKTYGATIAVYGQLQTAWVKARDKAEAEEKAEREAERRAWAATTQRPLPAGAFCVVAMGGARR